MGCGSSQEDSKQPQKIQPRPQQTTTLRNVKISPDIFISLKDGSVVQYYEINETLMEGKYSSVKKARHRNSGIVRVIKQIKKENLNVEDDSLRFGEVDLLRQLDHPNIVKIFDLYQDHKNYYIIQEYLPEGDLFDKLYRQNGFSESRIAEYMKQILSAVSFCHSKQIVHRDLKLENIMLESDTNIKIIDFGTTRKFNPKQMLHARQGSLYYMAPEVFKENYSEKCDIWSCGVIMYILITGTPPFNGSNAEIKQKILEGKVNYSQNVWEEISPLAKELIAQMLNYDPEQRISAQVALFSTWIQINTHTGNPTQEILDNMREFYSYSRWKTALKMFIISQLSKCDENHDLLQSFKAIDKNNDGTISQAELYDCYHNVNPLQTREEIQEIFKEIDINESGQIDYTGFKNFWLQHQNLMDLSKKKNQWLHLEPLIKMVVDGSQRVKFRKRLEEQKSAKNSGQRYQVKQMLLTMAESLWRNSLLKWTIFNEYKYNRKQMNPRSNRLQINPNYSPKSSESESSDQSYRSLIHEDQIENTIQLIEGMKFTVSEWGRNKISSTKGYSILSRMLTQEQKTTKQIPSNSIQEEYFGKYLSKKINESKQDDYQMKAIMNGHKVNLNFIPQQEERDVVAFYTQDSYSDFQMSERKKIHDSTIQSQQLQKLDQLIHRAEKTVLQVKLDKILQNRNKENSQQKESFYQQEQPLKKMNILRTTRRIAGQKESQVHSSSTASKKNKYQEKLEIYLKKKFGKNGLMMQSLSKTFKLRPIKLLQKPQTEKQRFTYQFPDLNTKQRFFFHRARVGKLNKEFLQADFDEIQTYLKSAIK